jgi:hypothetical protein
MFNYMVRTSRAAQPPPLEAAASRAQTGCQTPLAGFTDEEANTTRDLLITGAKRVRVAPLRVY